MDLLTQIIIVFNCAIAIMVVSFLFVKLYEFKKSKGIEKEDNEIDLKYESVSFLENLIKTKADSLTKDEWKDICLSCRFLNLSEKIFIDYVDDIAWQYVSINKFLTKEFIVKYEDYLHIDKLTNDIFKNMSEYLFISVDDVFKIVLKYDRYVTTGSGIRTFHFGTERKLFKNE